MLKLHKLGFMADLEILNVVPITCSNPQLRTFPLADQGKTLKQTNQDKTSKKVLVKTTVNNLNYQVKLRKT